MSDVNSSGTAKPDDANPANAQKPADDTDPAAVSEIAELKKSIGKLESSLARLIRTNSKEPKTTEDADTGKPAEETWKSRVKALEDRDKAINERAAKVSIESAFSDYGISGEYKRDAVRDFKDEHGGKLVYTDAGEVLVKASEIDEPVPVADLIKRLVSEKKYDRFRPAVQTPKTGPDGKPIAAKRQMTLAQYRDAHARREKINLADIELID